MSHLWDAPVVSDNDDDDALGVVVRTSCRHAWCNSDGEAVVVCRFRERTSPCCWYATSRRGGACRKRRFDPDGISAEITWITQVSRRSAHRIDPGCLSYACQLRWRKPTKSRTVSCAHIFRDQLPTLLHQTSYTAIRPRVHLMKLRRLAFTQYASPSTTRLYYDASYRGRTLEHTRLALTKTVFLPVPSIPSRTTA